MQLHQNNTALSTLFPPHLFLSACVAIYAFLCIFRAACIVTLLRNTFLHAGIQKCDILYLS